MERVSDKIYFSNSSKIQCIDASCCQAFLCSLIRVHIFGLGDQVFVCILTLLLFGCESLLVG